MSLALFLLGSLQIRLDETALTGFSTDKERALLVYLVMERQRSHRREGLAGLLWEEMPQEVAYNNLRKTLHRLRQTLKDNDRKEPFLLVTAKEVQCNPAADIWLDVDEFGRLINRFQSHKHRRAESCQICRMDQHRAATLYQGNFLEGFWLVDNVAFEEWAVGWRERLRSQALTLLGQLMEFTEREGDHVQAMTYAQQVAALEPWQESAHRALMRLLVLTGRRAAALVQYERLQKSLAEELGIEPESDTVHLYEQIRNGRFQPLPLQRQPGFLPPAMTPLIGRDHALFALQNLLHEPTNRLITIVGPGGIGKTRLALAGAANVRGDFPDGVWFVDLTSLADDEDSEVDDELRFVSRLAVVIATAIGLTLGGSETPKTQLLTGLKNWEGLLVLDNFERALAGVPLIQEILQTTTKVVFLATSREPLHLQAEHVFRLVGLTFPPLETVAEEIITYESVILFQAVAARSGEPITAEMLPTIGEICRFLEGIPLGIELAASWSSRLSLGEILVGLRTEYGRLAAAHRDIPERHRTMQAVFEGSWQLLSNEQQSALAQIAVFRGGFARDAADKVVRASWEDIVSLVDKSLLRLEANGRYTIHELLRQFAAVKLFQSAENIETAKRHSQYYLGFLAQKTAPLWQDKPQYALAELRQEFENIYSAWQSAAELGLFHLLSPALGALVTYYTRQGLFHEGIQVLRQTLAGVEADESGETRSLRGWLHVELARLLAPVTEFEEARTHAQAGFMLGKVNGDLALQGWSQFREGRSLWMQGHYKACLPLIEKALALAQAASIEQLEAESWLALSALADTFGGNFALARERGEKSLALFKRAGNLLGELRILNLLGNYSWGVGDYPLAQRYYEESLHHCRTVNSRQDEAAALANLGTVLREQGAYEEAVLYYEPALQLFLDMHAKRPAFVTLQNVSLLHHQTGNQLLALKYCQQALTLARELDTAAGESQPLCILGHILLALGRSDEAAAAYTQSVQLHRKIGNHHLAMEPLSGLVRTALLQQDFQQARFYAEEILTHLVGGTLNGTTEPIRIQLSVFQALSALKDPRANRSLESTYGSLMERAGKISDPKRQQSFLYNIPAHFEVIQRWHQVSAKKG